MRWCGCFGATKIYAKGDGIKKSWPDALRWYNGAARKGYAKAQLKLGGMYDFARHVKKNWVEALKWYTMAAAQGESGAQYVLSGDLILHL